jgi:hypothetical protein
MDMVSHKGLVDGDGMKWFVVRRSKFILVQFRMQDCNPESKGAFLR